MVLIGTVHLDPLCAPALRSILERMNPAVITVEISTFSVRYRSERLQEWKKKLCLSKQALPRNKRKHAGLKLLEYQIRLPFEWTVTAGFASDNGIRCIPVDTGVLARRELPLWNEELLSPENLRGVAGEPDFNLERYFSDCHREARDTLFQRDYPLSLLHPLSWLAIEYWKTREELLAKRIRRVSGICNGTTVHIAGWMHLIKESPWKTTADLLGDLYPVRYMVTRDPRGIKGTELRLDEG